MRLRRLLRRLVLRALERTRSAFDGYHPEAHFMRGPGPKCAARAPSRKEAA